MKIAIIGAGGVGGYFGARLAAAGVDVTFIARGAQLAALRERGISVRSANGDLRLAVHATEHASEVGVVDWVWIAVKLWDTEGAAVTARPLIGRETSVVSFQNGVEKEDVLRRVLPEAHLVGGVAYIGATIEEPGVIAHTGTLARLEFGEFDHTISPRVVALMKLCRGAGIDAEVPADIRRAIWRKFIMLVAASSVTTATRLPLGAVRTNHAARSLFAGVVEEAAHTGRALGVPLTEEDIAAALTQIDSVPPEMTSSMHRDLERGGRLELDWLSGAVVRLGAAAGVPTPLNRALCGVLSPWADGRPPEA